MGGGGVSYVKKTTPPFLGSKIMNLLGFFILSRKSVFGSQLHRVCVERSGTGANAVYAVFSRCCYVGVFGDRNDPVVPTLRCESGDVVTAYANKDAKGRFLQSLALPLGVSRFCVFRIQRTRPCVGFPALPLTSVLTVGPAGPRHPFHRSYREIAEFQNAVSAANKANAELHSLRADFNLKLQNARQLRNYPEIYMPHNADFRGRAYPMHPHLQHMGSDLPRCPPPAPGVVVPRPGLCPSAQRATAALPSKTKGSLDCLLGHFCIRRLPRRMCSVLWGMELVGRG